MFDRTMAHKARAPRFACVGLSFKEVGKCVVTCVAGCTQRRQCTGGSGVCGTSVGRTGCVLSCLLSCLALLLKVHAFCRAGLCAQCRPCEVRVSSQGCQRQDA